MSPSPGLEAPPPRWIWVILGAWIVATGTLLWRLSPIDVSTLSVCRGRTAGKLTPTQPTQKVFLLHEPR